MNYSCMHGLGIYYVTGQWGYHNSKPNTVAVVVVVVFFFFFGGGGGVGTECLKQNHDKNRSGLCERLVLMTGLGPSDD